jgi:hypothetical protein
VITKVCSKCDEEKDIEDFYKIGDKRRPECKKCTYYINKKYKLDNRDLILLHKKKYHQSEIGKETDKNFYQKYRKNIPKEVKDKLKKSHKIWCYNQYNTNSKYKFITSIRSLIGKSFKNSKKPNKTEEILGCSIDEFRKYIESKFIDGMNWNNQGKWHLDHIVPISWSKDIDDVIRLNHYTNFKPMWGIENIKKGNKYEG